MINEKLKTDGDVMTYLTNIQRALKGLAEQTGQIIDIRTKPDGYAHTEIGDYEITQLGEKVYYTYMPIGRTKVWTSIEPCQANFAGKPIEKPLAPGSNQGLDN